MQTFIIKLALTTAASVVTYLLASWIYKKVKTPLLNPLLVSAALLVILMAVIGIDPQDFSEGSVGISFFLGPATVALAFSVYKQWDLLKKNFVPIMAGCFIGSLTSMASAYLLCSAFGLGRDVSLSFVPKSVTMPIAVSVTQQLGGVLSITVAAVIVTGILGAILSPFLIRLFHIKNTVACGIAIGTCSHAVGTTKAQEMGQLEGAMSGVAIAVSGLITTVVVIIAHAISFV